MRHNLQPSSVDVARQAGVSRATVSAVVNGNKFVSEELRARVQEAIAKLGYRPDAIARSLKVNRTSTVGLVIPSIESHFWAPVVRGVEAALAEVGYRLLLANTDEEGGRAEAALEVFLRHRVDGAIVVPPGGSVPLHYRDYVNSGRPLVFVERAVPGVNADYAVVDGVAGGYLAASHLVEVGRTRIALVVMPLDVTASCDRIAGIRKALDEAGLSLEDDRIAIGRFTQEEGFAAARQLIRRTPRPDALIVASLRMTIGAFAALREEGLRIPDDVALVGYDETPWASLLTPPLTVVEQPARALGRAAAHMLLSRLNGEAEASPSTTVLQPRLIVRGSSSARPDPSNPPRARGMAVPAQGAATQAAAQLRGEVTRGEATE